MNEDRLDRKVEKGTDGSCRIYDLYDDKIVLSAKSNFVEARTSDDGKEILELILECGPYLQQGSRININGIKFEVTGFSIRGDDDVTEFFNAIVVDIYYEHLTAGPIRKVKGFKNKILKKLGFK